MASADSVVGKTGRNPAGHKWATDRISYAFLSLAADAVMIWIIPQAQPIPRNQIGLVQAL
jgi:hypothetical protein